MEFDSISKDNFSNTIALSIEEKILSGELQIGDKLPSEMALAQMFGVSRNVIRESLRIVQEWGLVNVRTGSGSYIQKPALGTFKKSISRLVVLNKIELDEFFELRILLESKAAYEAALHITSAELDTLKDTVTHMKLISNPADWVINEYTYHSTLAKASRNKLLYIFIDSLSEAMKSFFEQSFTMPHDYRAVPSHRKILNALQEHDAAQAEALMRAHLEDSHRWISGLQTK